MSFPALRSPISAARSVTEGLRSLRAPVSSLNVADAPPLSTIVDAVNPHSPDDSAPEEDSELKLPKLSSLISMLVLNGMSHLTMFIILPSASDYAQALGGNSVFAGLIIGITSLFAGIAIPGLMAIDKGTYMGPVIFSCILATIGNVLYGLAYIANFLWLVFIGRCVTGIGLVSFLYTKRYCTDSRIIGVRRRASVSAWLVVGQNVGFTLGPFLGGLLYKVGFHNDVFNGYTGPGWVMAVCWVAFLGVIAAAFEDVPSVASLNEPTRDAGRPVPMELRPTVSSTSTQATRRSNRTSGIAIEIDEAGVSSSDDEPFVTTWRTYALIFTMSWIAMTCFFVVGAWQSSIAPYTSLHFNWSPFAAGNFMALGGLCTFPFLFLNLYYARRMQDRYILAYGCGTGAVGLVLMMLIVGIGGEKEVTFGSFFVCWWLVALGFSVATTATVSLLSKQMPQRWNGRLSMAIQYGNYIGRVCGTVWGGAVLNVGLLKNVGVDLAVAGVGIVLVVVLWRDMKSKVG